MWWWHIGPHNNGATWITILIAVGFMVKLGFSNDFLQSQDIFRLSSFFCIFKVVKIEVASLFCYQTTWTLEVLKVIFFFCWVASVAFVLPHSMQARGFVLCTRSPARECSYRDWERVCGGVEQGGRVDPPCSIMYASLAPVTFPTRCWVQRNGSEKKNNLEEHK